MVDSNDDVPSDYQFPLGVEADRHFWVLLCLHVNTVLQILLLIDQLAVVAGMDDLQDGLKPAVFSESWDSSDYDLLEDFEFRLVLLWLG